MGKKISLDEECYKNIIITSILVPVEYFSVSHIRKLLLIQTSGGILATNLDELGHSCSVIHYTIEFSSLNSLKQKFPFTKVLTWILQFCWESFQWLQAEKKFCWKLIWKLICLFRSSTSLSASAPLSLYLNQISGVILEHKRMQPETRYSTGCTGDAHSRCPSAEHWSTATPTCIYGLIHDSNPLWNMHCIELLITPLNWNALMAVKSLRNCNRSSWGTLFLIFKGLLIPLVRSSKVTPASTLV